jgi:hypothetical protein
VNARDCGFDVADVLLDGMGFGGAVSLIDGGARPDRRWWNIVYAGVFYT